MKSNTNLRILASLLLIALVAVLAAAPVPSAQAGVATSVHESGTPIPPDARYEGRSYNDWANKWWQWAYSMPITNNPLFDETGAKCGLGQSGNVWFLAGVFNDSATAHRTDCVIPRNKALFFPIINFEESNVEAIQDGVGTSESEIRDYVISVEDGVDLNSLQVEIDGVPIQNLPDYRLSAHTVLQGVNFRLPANNIIQMNYPAAVEGKCFYPDPLGPCVKYMLVTDGYYLMIPPLATGTHVIHFHGSLPSWNFTLDITYDPLTVR